MTDFDYSFFDSAYHGDVQRMRGSLERGHDVNALAPLWKSVYQPTALAYAVWGNQPEAVHFLLEHGADPNHSDGVRPTPHHARASARNRERPHANFLCSLSPAPHVRRTRTTVLCTGRRTRAIMPSALSSSSTPAPIRM